MNATRSLGFWPSSSGIFLNDPNARPRRFHGGSLVRRDQSFATLLLRGDQLLVQTRQLPIVTFRCVLLPNQFPARSPHVAGQLRRSRQRLNRSGKCIYVATAIQNPGFAMKNQFPPRAGIRRNHRSRLRVGLQNRFPQRLIGMGRQHCEPRSCDEQISLRRTDMPNKLHIPQPSEAD